MDAIIDANKPVTVKVKVRSNTTINVFIDTNVLAYWTLIERMIKRKRGTKRKEILERYKNLKQAYDFLDFVTKRKIEGYNFLTSKLALSELIAVLSEAIMSEKMSLNGIATIYWPKYRKDFLLNREELKEFQYDVIRKINFIFLRMRIHVVDDETLELFRYPYFIGALGLLTQDAILLNTAIKENSNYFVTIDRDLIDLNDKKEIKKEFDEVYRLRIIKPQGMLLELKKNDEIKV